MLGYWKEQEEKKLRELGMDEEKIQKLRQIIVAQLSRQKSKIFIMN